uniref:Uncharacterized protein n=1 Tax=Arundo donax TaxID=35708 RepID=A0A0A8XUV7_ARUDO
MCSDGLKGKMFSLGLGCSEFLLILSVSPPFSAATSSDGSSPSCLCPTSLSCLH